MERLPLADRIEGFRRFFAMANDRGPLVGFLLDSYFPLRRFRTEGFIAQGPLAAGELPVERFLPEYERLWQSYEELGGDFIWAGAAFWGVPWVEALAGCGVYADQQTGSTRSVPPEDFRGVEDLPAFDPEGPWARKAREFLSHLRERSAGRFPLGTTLMRGISDLLSALYGGPEFLFRLMDHPAEQRRLVRALTDLWLAFARHQLAEIPDFHGGVGSYFYSMWLPGRGVFLQDDASALMSPQLYGEFIYPAVAEIAGAFDTTVMHLHPSTYIPVDFLIDSPLSAIELHIDLGGPSAEQLYPYYRKIQSRKPLLIWGDLSEADVEFIARRLDRRSLAVLPVVGSREQAEAIGKRLRARGR